MSGIDETPPKRITMLSITATDFARFLEHKLAEEDRCPLCGKDHWTILCPTPDGIYRLGAAVRNQPEQFYVSTFGYYCDNCGLVRHHIASLVYAWVRDNPDPAPGVDYVDYVSKADYGEVGGDE